MLLAGWQMATNPQKKREQGPAPHDESLLDPPAMPPLLDGKYARAGYPDHCCARTGELVHIGVLPRSVLKDFVNPGGELTRTPTRVVINQPPVSGDMLCNWLLGYVSPWAKGEMPLEQLIALGRWMRANHEGPTERMDCGYRRNPMMVGAQAVLPMALYWTLWGQTKDRQWFWHYIKLGLMGYWYLCVWPTAFMHQYPKWLTGLSQWLRFSLPHNPRSLYNDANCMRCIAVLLWQTGGIHQAFWSFCAKNVWFMSKEWYLPFMDYYASGAVPDETKDVVCEILKNWKEKRDYRDDKYPIKSPKWGESWDDERYQSELGNSDSIGPIVEWHYANL